MKTRMKRELRNLLFVFGAILMFSSCEYKEIADTEYPDQVLYMPSAGFEIYDASVSTPTHSVPTPGGPSRFMVDNASSKVVIPLSVYRGGIDLDGKVVVQVHLDSEIILEMIGNKKLINTELLPSSEVSLPSTVEIKDGEDMAIFNLEINLNYVKSDLSRKVAIGVGILSESREVNPDLQTTVVVFDPKVFSE